MHNDAGTPTIGTNTGSGMWAVALVGVVIAVVLGAIVLAPSTSPGMQLLGG